MILGAYTFENEPDRFTEPRAQKYNASVKTYSSVAYFSWGASIVGQEILVEWDKMTSAQFTALDAIYQADLPTTWDPTGTGIPRYSVEVKTLDGKYVEYIGPQAAFRQDVKMLLLILGVL